MNAFLAAAMLAAVLGALMYWALGTDGWPIYLLLVVGLAATNATRRSFWRFPADEEGKDVAAWDYSKAARLRRRKMGLSIERIKHRVPFARLEAILAILWLGINFSTFFTLWVLAVLEGAINPWHALDIFVVYLAFSTVYVFVTRVESWGHSRAPETQRIHIAGMPELFADGHVPGQHVGSVDLPVAEEPGPDGKIPTTPFYFEVILCKHLKSMPKWLHARPVLVIADASLPGPRAGYNKGLVYEIDCRPDPYIAGDMWYWRLGFWVEMARAKLGNAQVPDSMVVILATERIKMPTGEVAPLPPLIVREMYAMRKRNMQTESDLDHYTITDKSREGMQ